MSARTAYQNDQHTELKVYLIRRGLSQRQIAKALGVSVQYLNTVIRNKRPGESLRKRLVNEFGIPAELIRYRPGKAA